MLGTTLFGKTALRALLVAIWASASVPTAAYAEKPDLARGEQLYALCAQCHGVAGGGNSAALAPAIANLPQWYLETQLKKFKSGVRGLHPEDTGGLRMYPMSQWLREDADLVSVAAYVASLPRVHPEDEIESAGDAARGQGYYAVCSACHGANGKGSQPMGAPPLVGLSDWYIQSTLKKFKAGIRGSGPGDALGSAMMGMASTLPDDQAILDVIAHLESLREKNAN